MAQLDSVMLTLHVLLFVVGVIVTIFILRVYSLYRIMQINRTVMTPMLFVGLFIALQGVTELIESYIGEIGQIAHAASMFLGAVFFLYGIYSYHQMLKRASQPR